MGLDVVKALAFVLLGQIAADIKGVLVFLGNASSS